MAAAKFVPPGPGRLRVSAQGLLAKRFGGHMIAMVEEWFDDREVARWNGWAGVYVVTCVIE